MKRTLTILFTLLFTLSIFAAPPQRRGAAGPGGGPGGPGGPGPGPEGGAPREEILSPRAFAEFLGLSEAQQDQIKTLRDNLRATTEPLMDQMRENRAAVDAAIEAGNAQAAGEALLAGKAIRTQIKAARDSFKSAVAALLTPEQKAKWDVYQQIVELRH